MIFGTILGFEARVLGKGKKQQAYMRRIWNGGSRFRMLALRRKRREAT
jgi:hypothetical protein